MQVEDREWRYESFQTLNLNMFNQNTEMLEELQVQLTEMQNKLISQHRDIINKLNQGGRRLENNKAFNVAIEDSRSEGDIENEEVEEDMVGLVEVNMKLEQLHQLQKELQKEMDDRFGRWEDKFEERLDRLETLLDKLVEQQATAR